MCIVVVGGVVVGFNGTIGVSVGARGNDGGVTLGCCTCCVDDFTRLD